jgi:hypothetical protein
MNSSTLVRTKILGIEILGSILEDAIRSSLTIIIAPFIEGR